MLVNWHMNYRWNIPTVDIYYSSSSSYKIATVSSSSCLNMVTASDIPHQFFIILGSQECCFALCHVFLLFFLVKLILAYSIEVLSICDPGRTFQRCFRLSTNYLSAPLLRRTASFVIWAVQEILKLQFDSAF